MFAPRYSTRTTDHGYSTAQAILDAAADAAAAHPPSPLRPGSPVFRSTSPRRLDERVYLANDTRFTTADRSATPPASSLELSSARPASPSAHRPSAAFLSTERQAVFPAVGQGAGCSSPRPPGSSPTQPRPGTGAVYKFSRQPERPTRVLRWAQAGHSMLSTGQAYLAGMGSQEDVAAATAAAAASLPSRSASPDLLAAVAAVAGCGAGPAKAGRHCGVLLGKGHLATVAERLAAAAAQAAVTATAAHTAGCCSPSPGATALLAASGPEPLGTVTLEASLDDCTAGVGEGTGTAAATAPAAAPAAVPAVFCATTMLEQAELRAQQRLAAAEAPGRPARSPSPFQRLVQHQGQPGPSATSAAAATKLPMSSSPTRQSASSVPRHSASSIGSQLAAPCTTATLHFAGMHISADSAAAIRAATAKTAAARAAAGRKHHRHRVHHDDDTDDHHHHHHHHHHRHHRHQQQHDAAPAEAPAAAAAAAEPPLPPPQQAKQRKSVTLAAGRQSGSLPLPAGRQSAANLPSRATAAARKLQAYKSFRSGALRWASSATVKSEDDGMSDAAGSVARSSVTGSTCTTARGDRHSPGAVLLRLSERALGLCPGLGLGHSSRSLAAGTAVPGQAEVVAAAALLVAAAAPGADGGNDFGARCSSACAIPFRSRQGRFAAGIDRDSTLADPRFVSSPEPGASSSRPGSASSARRSGGVAAGQGEGRVPGPGSYGRDETWLAGGRKLSGSWADKGQSYRLYT